MVGLLNKAAGQEDQVNGQAADDEIENDGALADAIEYIGSRLYDENLAGEVARALDGAPKAMPKILAGIAYKLAQAADTETNGEVMEENLSILGMLALNEIITIAEASGMAISGATASAAMKQMVIMYAEDNGIPSDELAGLMANVSDQDVAMLADEAPDDLESNGTMQGA